jgi:hypothetical protein
MGHARQSVGLVVELPQEHLQGLPEERPRVVAVADPRPGRVAEEPQAGRGVRHEAREHRAGEVQAHREAGGGRGKWVGR